MPCKHEVAVYVRFQFPPKFLSTNWLLRNLGGNWNENLKSSNFELIIFWGASSFANKVKLVLLVRLLTADIQFYW